MCNCWKFRSLWFSMGIIVISLVTKNTHTHTDAKNPLPLSTCSPKECQTIFFPGRSPEDTVRDPQIRSISVMVIMKLKVNKLHLQKPTSTVTQQINMTRKNRFNWKPRLTWNLKSKRQKLKCLQNYMVKKKKGLKHDQGESVYNYKIG